MTETFGSGSSNLSRSAWGELEPPSPDPEWGQPENGNMTRDERIADGKEKVDALKNKAKAGLNKMMQGLKDRFYIGVSQSAELSGQLAEKGAEAKETMGNAWAAARERASELFDKGREFIAQEAEKANNRKMARQQRRRERRAELDSREFERDARKNDRHSQELSHFRQQQAAEVGEIGDEYLIGREQKVIAGTAQELESANEKVAEAKREEQRLIEEAEKAKTEAESAKAAADADPTNDYLRLDAEEKAALSVAAEVRLQRAQLNAKDVVTEANLLRERIELAESNIKSARERMEERRQGAKKRKAERAAARREARGDRWEAAKDRVKRAANDDPNLIKRFGAKMAVASGGLARKAANSIVSKVRS